MNPRRSDLVSAFTKKVITQGVAAKKQIDPFKYALNRWGNALCPEWNERAAIAGASTVDGAFKSESQAFFDAAFEASVPGRMPLRRVPFDVRLTSVVTGASASWVRQGAGKPITKASLAATPFTRPPGQKPDALASMGCLGGWIVMPEATALSVSTIVSFSAFLPHCRLRDLIDSLSALSI
jgi:hypothetical protein